MHVHVYPKPANMRGDNLAAEIAAAGFRSVSVGVVGSEVHVTARTTADQPTDDTHTAAIGAIVSAHTGQPTATQQAEADARAEILAARGRLDEMRRKGWANLTTTERTEVQRLVLTALGRI